MRAPSTRATSGGGGLFQASTRRPGLLPPRTPRSHAICKQAWVLGRVSISLRVLVRALRESPEWLYTVPHSPSPSSTSTSPSSSTSTSVSSPPSVTSGSHSPPPVPPPALPSLYLEGSESEWPLVWIPRGFLGAPRPAVPPPSPAPPSPRRSLGGVWWLLGDARRVRCGARFVINIWCLAMAGAGGLCVVTLNSPALR